MLTHSGFRSHVQSESASSACPALLPCLPRAQEHGGYENLTEGDSFICSFHGPTCAVEFARRCQKHLLRLDWCDACNDFGSQMALGVSLSFLLLSL